MAGNKTLSIRVNTQNRQVNRLSLYSLPSILFMSKCGPRVVCFRTLITKKFEAKRFASTEGTKFHSGKKTFFHNFYSEHLKPKTITTGCFFLFWLI